jgi:clan AA aspartic protease (TIGR02281 family)
MQRRAGIGMGLSIGCLMGVMLMAGAMAESMPKPETSALNNEQAAAVAFFNRIAQESTNPYITAVARENAARLGSGSTVTAMVNRYEVPVIAQPDNSIAVPAILNEKTMGTFIIDTGSSYTVITPRMAKKLGIEILPDTDRVSIITANGIIQAPIITLNNVTIGRVRVNGVQAVVQDLGNDLMLSGLLGMNFFKGKSLTIRQNSLILEESDDSAKVSSR